MSQKNFFASEQKQCIGLWLQEKSVSGIAQRLRRSRQWVYKWIRRYRSSTKSWFLDRSRSPHRMARRVSNSFERLVIRIHRRLKSTRNPLGFYGAEAIYNELIDLAICPLHSIRTIHRILHRHRLVTRKRRDRSRKGPILPGPMARRQNDVHQVGTLTHFSTPPWLSCTPRTWSLAWSLEPRSPTEGSSAFWPFLQGIGNSMESRGFCKWTTI